MRIRETLQTLNLGFPKQAVLSCQKSGILLVLLQVWAVWNGRNDFIQGAGSSSALPFWNISLLKSNLSIKVA